MINVVSAAGSRVDGHGRKKRGNLANPQLYRVGTDDDRVDMCGSLIRPLARLTQADGKGGVDCRIRSDADESRDNRIRLGARGESLASVMTANERHHHARHSDRSVGETDPRHGLTVRA